MTPLNFISYPYSHSLFGVFVWAILLGAIYYMLKKNFRTSLLLRLLVLSHWILDLFTHRPDLQLLPWSDFKMGFGLWNSVVLTIIIEGFIFILGAYFYMHATKPENKKGSYGLWSFFDLFNSDLCDEYCRHSSN
ncbi:MAG: metal-dependent hydrolase [Melioribacteraceae bacterium]